MITLHKYETQTFTDEQEQAISELNDAIAKLNRLRTKKGLTDKQYKADIADIVDLLINFFI